MHKIKKITRHDKFILKKIIPREKLLDLSVKEVFELEVEALQRLQVSARFPKIASLDETNFLIKMTYCGHPLNRIQKRHAEEGYFISKYNYKKIKRQIDYIVYFLEKKNISYLDLKPSNICISEKINIHLIDFGMVVVDDKPMGHVLNQRYEEFCAKGGYSRFSKDMKEMVFDLIKCSHE